MDTREASAQIQASKALQESMASTAQKHNARLEGEAAPDTLAAIRDMAGSIAVLDSRQEGSADAASGGNGAVPAFSQPQLQLSSPSGIAATTPASTIVSAGTSSSMTAGQDINLVSQGNSASLVAKGISLFTYGKASSADKPNQEVGIKLHAASGKVSAQSQTGATSITADKAVTVASVTKSVTIGAPNKHVMLTAQGAFIKLEGGNIMVHGPGKMEFKASKKELKGPVSVTSTADAHKVGELNLKRDLEIEYVDADGNVLSDEPIAFNFSDGGEQRITLDGSGKATIKDAPLGPLSAKQPRRK
jgi:type VI secretion system secreted protein VgrG